MNLPAPLAHPSEDADRDGDHVVLRFRPVQHRPNSGPRCPRHRRRQYHLTARANPVQGRRKPRPTRS
jgi:hypothetical protein